MDRESVSEELKDSQLNCDPSLECSALYPRTAYWNAFEGQSYPSSLYSEFPMNDIYLFQDFHFFLVIDFEATCDKEKVPVPQEIIEFPSVIVDSITGEIVACFQTYVKPMYNPQLTDFCKGLTGIQQNQVDGGVTLSEALLRHDLWLEKLGVKKYKFAVVTWSDWDCRVMLESECRFKKISKPSYFNQWINLKVPFHEVFGGESCKLKRAVEIAGLPWIGRAHSGIDDSVNTARILSLLLHWGVKLSITGSLNQAPENPPYPLYTPVKEVEKMETMAYPLYTPVKEVETGVYPRCFCGVICKQRRITRGGTFYVCGNWTEASGSRCSFFQFLCV